MNVLVSIKAPESNVPEESSSQKRNSQKDASTAVKIPVVKTKANNQKNQSTINFGENANKTIGPPVQVAKNMRDFEKDESLFNFGTVKPSAKTQSQKEKIKVCFQD